MKLTFIRKDIKLHPRMLQFLAELETEAIRLNGEVISTDADRTVLEHIAIYKKLYGAKWLEKIAWDSKHLPNWDGYLHALDLKIKLNTGAFLPGEKLKQLTNKICTAKKIKRGLGVGKEFIHFDIRDVDGDWTYNY